MPAGDPSLRSTGTHPPLSSSLLYPTQIACLTTLLALSIGMPLTIAPAAGYVAQLVLWAAGYHYAVEVFTRSANGTPKAPDFAPESDGIGWTLLILQLLFSACLWWLDARVETAALRWLGIAAIAFLQPAMTLTTAMNREVGSALNPARVLRVVRALGAAYLPLVAAGLGMNALQHGVNWVVNLGRMQVFATVMSVGVGSALVGIGVLTALYTILAGFAWFYAVVAYFRAMGLAIHARADALGFDPTPQRRLRPEDRHASLLARVEDFAARNQHAAAAAMLGECLATQPHASAEMHARYRELLRCADDRTALLAHARMRIDALLAAGSIREAIGLAHEALTIDPDFRPSSAERTTELAQAAEKLGQPSLALALLRDFTARYPFDAAIPDNALAAARLLEQRQADLPAAHAVLQGAIDCMLPAHPQYAALRAEQQRIALLAGKT